MKSHNGQAGEWSKAIYEKSHAVFAQISAIQEWAARSDASSETLGKLLMPQYRLLESIFQDDLPLAQAYDTSDLLMYFTGPAVDHHSPKLSLLAGIFQNVRKQVGSVAFSIANVANRNILPKEVDLDLTGFAKGSLFMGFSLPELGIGDDGAGYLFGVNDPLYSATRQAIKAIGSVSTFLQDGASEEEIAHAIPNPRQRDATIAAVQQLAPSGRTGITKVSLSGRESGLEKSAQLTPEVRREARQLTRHPVRNGRFEEFTGTVREIDLDASRFDLRHIIDASLNDIRCAYPESLEAKAKASLDKHITVRGNVEFAPDGKPSLLDVQELIIAGDFIQGSL